MAMFNLFKKKPITCDHPEIETKTKEVIQVIQGLINSDRDVNETRYITYEITKCVKCDKTLNTKIIDKKVKLTPLHQIILLIK
ncbi:hypothetical protein [Myroides odoratus]|nr:hypothetical protein [Myroides odoratus]WQD58868.1 hypothetical protein U0010_06920 [Myroides odoratus]